MVTHKFQIFGRILVMNNPCGKSRWQNFGREEKKVINTKVQLYCQVFPTPSQKWVP